MEFDEEKIDALLAEIDQCHLPGAAVGIVVRGRPVYRKGFGLANAELPVALSSKTRMRLFSVSKHFTCLAFLLLCEEGRASIDEPIGNYLIQLNPVARAVTPRQLMGNISGLRDSHDIAWVLSSAGSHFLSTELLSFYHSIDDVNAPPGVSWIYNNGGFLLLTFLIERISGLSMEEFLRQRIFEPAGMYDTMLRRTNTDFVANSATMHMTSPTSGYDRSYLGGERGGEGGIVSTVDDMLRWLAHMDAPVVGAAATWALMKTPQTLANGTSTGYGLGLFVGRYRGVEMIFHSGGGMGANAHMVKVPAAGLDVIVMANRHDVDSSLLANRIVDACVPGLEPVPEKPARTLSKGNFRSPTTGRVVQLFASDGRQRAWIDNYDIPMESDKDGRLRPAPPMTFLEQTLTIIGDTRKPHAIRFDDFGTSDRLLRARTDGKPDLSFIRGRYRSECTETDAMFEANETGLQLQTFGRFGSSTFEMQCLARGLWHAKSWLPWMGGIVSFDEEMEGFRFTTARNRALPFRRTCRSK